MDTCNILPESYQQRVYKNTLAIVEGKIHLVEHPTPAMVISVEAVRVDNAMHGDYRTSELAHEAADIGMTESTILRDINCPDDKLHVGMHEGQQGLRRLM
jgi:hypothetical protein